MKSNLLSRCLRETKLKQNFSQFMNVRWTSTIAAENQLSFDEAALAAAKPFEQIPSPMKLPVIGTAWMYLPIIGRYDLRKQHLILKDKHKRYGKIMREKAGSVNIVISFNADDQHTVFKHEGQYPSRGEFSTLKAYRESRKQWYSNAGLLILQGKKWHDLRSKTQKHLMKPKAIQPYLNPMQDVARDLVEKILRIKDTNKEVPNFLDELYKWALESVAFVGLDTRLGCLRMDLPLHSEGIRMINSAQTQFECMGKLEGVCGNIEFWKVFETPTWRRFTAAADTFTEIASKYINRALEDLKSANEDKDLTLLQSMLMTKGLDVSGAMVTVNDMLMAGIDTTSHSVGFLLYHLAKHPDKQELLHEEIKSLLPTKKDRITTNIYNELKYLKACLKETQRLMPIVSGSARLIDHDIVLSGYRIPAGTVVVMGLHEIYINEKYFSNPLKYFPERWLEKDANFHPFSFVPFGVGTRSCIGRRLAELEIISLVTEIIRNFRIEYHHEDIGIASRLINIPDKPLKFNFIER